MIRLWFYIFLFLFLIIRSVNAQSLIEAEIAEMAEYLVAQQDDDSSYEEVYDQLLLRFTEPLNLNQADEDELRGLHFLSERQVAAIMHHRNQAGLFISILELQALDGFESGNWRRWMPFLSVQGSGNTNWKQLPQRLLNPASAYFAYRSDGALITRIPAFINSGNTTTLPGSPWSGSFRFRISHNNDFSFAWNAERDRGEKFLWDPSRKWFGFDFNSFHFQVLNKPRLKNLIIGDYTASFGQGMVLGGGFRVGKGAETITALRRGGHGFRPYGSLGESGFFRGLAVSVPVTDNFSMHLMGSRIFRDGTVRYTEDSLAFVSTLQSTGIHRSNEEQQSRKTWNEINVALASHVKFRRIDAGFIINRQIFSLPVLPFSTVYNRFQFRGQHNLVGSLFFNGQYRNWAFFSEAAASIPSRGTGWVMGLLGSLSPEFDLSILLRKYSPGFHSFHGSSFSENTTSVNEQGIYLGWKYKKGRQFQLAGYSDFFQFPYLKFRVYKPSEGMEHMARVTRNFTRKNFVSVQYRLIRKERNAVADNSSFYETIPVTRQVWNLQFDYQLSQKLTARTRLSSTYIKAENFLTGHMMLQDLFLDLGALDVSLRYSIFGSEDYEARLYAYERDVWMSYSFPSWYGYGTRMYVVGQFRVAEKITLWFKWSAVRYADATPSENTLDENAQSYRADLRVQLRWML